MKAVIISKLKADGKIKRLQVLVEITDLETIKEFLEEDKVYLYTFKEIKSFDYVADRLPFKKK